MEDWFSLQQAGSVGSLLLAAGLFAGALLALALTLSAQELRLRPEAGFWRLLAMALLLLAANSLAEGELLLGNWLREQARAEHWYEWRRYLQFFALAIGLLAGAALWRWIAGLLARLHYPLAPRLALLGLLPLLILPLLRGVSFHYTDALLYWTVLGLGLGRWAELLGLGLVALAGLQQWRGFIMLQHYRP